jgi:hypothetical protein
LQAASSRQLLAGRFRTAYRVSQFGRSLSKGRTRLYGRPVRVVLPCFSFDKRVLLDPDLYDESGRRLVMLTRSQDSQFAAHHVLGSIETACLAAAEAFPELRKSVEDVFPAEDLLPLLTAIAYCMPSGIRTHLNAVDANGIGQYLQTRGHGTLRAALPINELLERGELLGQRWIGIASKHPGSVPFLWDAAEPLRDPVFNPLLVLPEYVRLLGGSSRDSDELPSQADVRLFLDLAARLFTLLELLQDGFTRAQNAAQGEILLQPLSLLERFCQSWVMCVPTPVSIGEHHLIKFTQVVPVLELLLRLPWYRRQIETFKTAGYLGYAQGVRVTLGDAQSTHIEVVSPDPTTVRLNNPRAYGAYAGGILFAGQKAPAFGSGGVVDVYADSEDRLSVYSTLQPGDIVRRSGGGGRRNLSGLYDARLHIVFRPLRRVKILYTFFGLFTAFAAFAALVSLKCLDFPSHPRCRLAFPPHLPNAASFLILLLVGFLTTRDQETISARCLQVPRRILVYLLPVLLFDIARGLVAGR